MAFVPGFKHDIFISYARDNNSGGEEGAGGRITQLHRRLEERLRELTSRELSIWRDITIARNQEFEKKIKEAAENSAILLAIYSDAHRQSPYCKQEIDLFSTRSQNDGHGLSVNDRKRIFNVLLQEIHHSKWPPAFQGASCYNFFEKTPGHEITLPAEPESKQFQDEFKVLLRDLGSALQEFKKVIEQKSAQSTAPPMPHDDSTFTVFLAETSDDLRRTMRRRLITELQEKGVRLAEPVPPPLELESHDKKAIREIKRSHLCLHLFDGSPGRDIDDAPDQFYTHRQVELGKQYAQQQLIWFPNSISYDSISYELHSKFLRELETAKRDQSSYVFIRESLTADAVIREVLGYRRIYEEETAVRNNPSMAVLDAHFDDLTAGAVAPLKAKLAARQVDWDLNFGEIEPRKNVEKLIQKLKTASYLVMVFGQWDRTQFFSRLREALKMCFEAEVKVRSCAIYFAPPHSLANEQKFDLGGFIRLHQFDSSNIDDGISEWLDEK